MMGAIEKGVGQLLDIRSMSGVAEVAIIRGYGGVINRVYEE